MMKILKFKGTRLTDHEHLYLRLCLSISFSLDLLLVCGTVIHTFHVKPHNPSSVHTGSTMYSSHMVYTKDQLININNSMRKTVVCSSVYSQLTQLNINKCQRTHRGSKGFKRSSKYIPVRLTDSCLPQVRKSSVNFDNLVKVNISKRPRIKSIISPTVYLTNCRSLSDNKLDVIQQTAELYQASVCLTET